MDERPILGDRNIVRGIEWRYICQLRFEIICDDVTSIVCKRCLTRVIIRIIIAMVED